ncbi:hypothetical protein P4O66_022699 [Electrophorus voltai]|uniref:Uncharacterized protein n=1 Tax=Electrophorus voltai TaxID=2609070 RepID=A0AAD8ZND1_9TELE|nr:hypothetical protein P4O66_022699 [Electrophorus voltai]
MISSFVLLCLFPWQGTRRAEDREQAWCSLEGEVSVPLFPLAHSPRELPSHTPLAHSPGPDDSVHSTVHFPLSQRDRQPDTTERQSAAPTLRHLEASQRNCPSLCKQTETPDSANEVTEGREWRLDGITAIVAGGSLGNSGKSRGLEWGVGIKPHKQTSSSHNNGAAISEFADWQAGKGDGQESGRLFGSGIRMSRLERECPPKTGSPDIGTESGLETDAMVGKSEGSGPGLEGAGLECCPMCLMLFPEGVVPQPGERDYGQGCPAAWRAGLWSGLSRSLESGTMVRVVPQPGERDYGQGCPAAWRAGLWSGLSRSLESGTMVRVVLQPGERDYGQGCPATPAAVSHTPAPLPSPPPFGFVSFYVQVPLKFLVEHTFRCWRRSDPSAVAGAFGDGLPQCPAAFPSLRSLVRIKGNCAGIRLSGPSPSQHSAFVFTTS